jgi:hypothetical protein
MRLLDDGVATVNPAPGSRMPSDGRWAAGYNNSTRACAVHMEIQDPCGGEANIAIMGTVTGRPASYFVQPFAVRAYLRQSVSCEGPDDKDWFRESARAKLEYVAGRGLVQQFAPTVETWIGDAGVQSVALPGTSAAQYRTAVAAAYDLWNASVASSSGEPLMHVPPSLVPDLQAAGILSVTSPDEISSVYSSKVVSTPGYDLNAKIFFSGEIVIRVGEPDDEGGALYFARINDVTLSMNTLMAIDVAPCSIVRVGA